MRIKRLEKIRKSICVVHGISPKGGAGSSDVSENISIWDRFKFVFEKRNQLRCSTIDNEDYGLWYPVGFRLFDGEITHAYPDDGGTSYSNGKVIINEQLPYDICEQVKRAINDRKPNRYNELIVKDPEFDGIYFCPSDTRMKDIPITNELLYNETHSFNLPYFLLTGEGKFVEIQYNKENKVFSNH